MIGGEEMIVRRLLRRLQIEGGRESEGDSGSG